MKANLLKSVVSVMVLIYSYVLPINAIAACDLPSQLKATPTGNSVSFTWSGNGTSYLIEVENTGTNQTVIPETTTGSPYVATLSSGPYKFKIRTLCGKDKSNWSDWVSFSVGSNSNPPPGGGSTCSIPTQLGATTTATGASLTWIGTASAYQIEVEHTVTDVKVVPEQSASSPFSVSLLSGAYKFKVRSVCGGDHSDWSATFSFTTGGGTNPNPPGGGGNGGTCTVPSQLTSTVIDNNIKLSWTDTATSLFQIEIENIVNDSTVVSEQSTFNPYFGSLSDGRYKFKVRALCNGNKSDWSAWSSFVVNKGTVAASDDPTIKINTSCTSQVNLSVIIAKDSSLTLKWPGLGVSIKYNIEVESEETAIKFRFKLEDLKDTFIVISGLIPNTQYKISITTNCGNGISARPGVLQSTTPLVNSTTNGTSKFACDIPTGLSVKVDATGILISWLPSAGARSYQIELESQENTPAFKRAIAVSTTSFLFNSTLAAGKYKVKVRPSCLNGKGSWSSAVSFSLIQSIAFKSGIENRSAAAGIEMEIYPNPAQGSFNIKTTNPNKVKTDGLVHILNVQGQVLQVYKNINFNTIQQIGIQNLVPGIYYIKLDTEYCQKIKKLVVH